MVRSFSVPIFREIYLQKAKTQINLLLSAVRPASGVTRR